MKLTEKGLAKIPPASTAVQDYYWDEDTKGFGLVVGRTGVITFVARAWVGPKKRRVKIGVAGSVRSDGHVWNVTLARIEAKRLLGDMAGGIDPNAAKRTPGGPTLRDGLTLHIANMRAGKNRRRKACSPLSIHKFESEVPRHLGEWLDRPIVELTAVELQKVCDRIEANTKPMAGAVNKPGVAQANKIIAHVSAIWNALDKLEDLPGKNPATRLSLSALKPREARIDDGGFADWYAKVLAMENPVRSDLQLVSLFTGMRSDSIRNLVWTDVDWTRGLLHVSKAKGGQPYALPLVPTVRKILSKRQADNAQRFVAFGGDNGFVFPSLSRDQKRVQAVAEVKERRTVHDPADPNRRGANTEDAARPDGFPEHGRKRDEDGTPVRETYLPGIHANRRTFNSVAIEIGIPPEPRLTLMNHEGKGVNAKHYGVPQNWEYIRECAERIEAALWQRLTPKAKKKR